VRTRVVFIAAGQMVSGCRAFRAGHLQQFAQAATRA